MTIKRGGNCMKCAQCIIFVSSDRYHIVILGIMSCNTPLELEQMAILISCTLSITTV